MSAEEIQFSLFDLMTLLYFVFCYVYLIYMMSLDERISTGFIKYHIQYMSMVHVHVR